METSLSLSLSLSGSIVETSFLVNIYEKCMLLSLAKKLHYFLWPPVLFSPCKAPSCHRNSIPPPLSLFFFQQCYSLSVPENKT